MCTLSRAITQNVIKAIMKSLLVIGGSGFFGKTILDAYRRGRLSKWQITKIYVFARNADFLKISNPELLGVGVVLINGDVTNCMSLPTADYVIHAAASSDASKYIEAPEIEKRNILAGTVNFCNLISPANNSVKILYVSSGAVYGDSSPHTKPFSEEDEFIPIMEVSENKRHYCAAKRDSEKHIIALGRSGSNVAIARCFAFIGKYLPRDKHFAIGNFLRDALSGVDIKVSAESLVYRSYMYSDDLVEWLMKIIESADNTCPIYNVGSSTPIEVRDLAKMIAEILDVGVKYKDLRYDAKNYYIPQIKLANKNLGLNITMGLELAIKTTILQIKAE